MGKMAKTRQSKTDKTETTKPKSVENKNKKIVTKAEIQDELKKEKERVKELEGQLSQLKEENKTEDKLAEEREKMKLLEEENEKLKEEAERAKDLEKEIEEMRKEMTRMEKDGNEKKRRKVADETTESDKSPKFRGFHGFGNTSSEESLGEESDEDTEQGDFKVEDEEVLELAKARATEEIARMEKNKQKGSKQKSKYEQIYTIKKFVFEIMQAGFTKEYMGSRKLTNQSAKKGEDLRRPMKPVDISTLIRLSQEAWGKVAAKEQIEKVVRTSITAKFNVYRKKPTLK